MSHVPSFVEQNNNGRLKTLLFLSSAQFDRPDLPEMFLFVNVLLSFFSLELEFQDWGL